MIDALFLLALLGGFFAEWHGSIAARALIATTALSSALILSGAPFDMGAWLAIDITAIVAIESGPVGGVEHAVIALFPAAWVLYHLQPPWGHDAITLIVAMQFLLLVPWDRLEQRIWKARTA